MILLDYSLDNEQFDLKGKLRKVVTFKLKKKLEETKFIVNKERILVNEEKREKKI
jgi:hypothetical protein